MKIAIAAGGETLESRIPATFEESGFLLVVETDDGSYEAYTNPEGWTGPGFQWPEK